MDELLAEHKRVMGSELGEVFFALHNKLVVLHIIWQQYRQLFGSNDGTIDLLNRTSGLFFKIVQDELWDSVLLGISRMTDSAQTGARRNLTLQSLPPLIADPVLRAEVQKLCDYAATDAEFAREHRNKRIAHHDHEYFTNPTANALNGISRQRIEGMLSAFRLILNRLNTHFFDSTTLYEVFVDDTGARLLLQKLMRLERADKAGSTC